MAGKVTRQASGIVEVALFANIHNTITTIRQPTVGSAVLVHVASRPVHARVALLTTINDTITACGKGTSGSTGTRTRIRVQRSIITSLTGINKAITTSTVRKRRNIEVKLRQERRGSSSTVVENSNTEPGSISLLVKELSLKVSMNTINSVLRRGGEKDHLKGSSIEGRASSRQEHQLSSSVDYGNSRWTVG
jgi:hypothetical protein